MSASGVGLLHSSSPRAGADIASASSGLLQRAFWSFLQPARVWLPRREFLDASCSLPVPVNGFSFFLFLSLHLVSVGSRVSCDSAGLTDFLDLGVALDCATVSFTSRSLKPFMSVPCVTVQPFPRPSVGSVSGVTPWRYVWSPQCVEGTSSGLCQQLKLIAHLGTRGNNLFLAVLLLRLAQLSM